MKTKLFRNLSFCFVWIALFVSCKPSIETNFKVATNDYWNALINKNWDKSVSYFFPTKIATLGGFESAKEALEESMAPLTITTLAISNIQILHDKDDIYLGVASITFEADRVNQMNGKTYKIIWPSRISGRKSGG